MRDLAPILLISFCFTERQMENQVKQTRLPQESHVMVVAS
jgi:hypothetical protein